MTQQPADAFYRDLNKNGRLDPYEDFSLPIAARVEDLLAQMTLTEKAGLLFHAMAPMGGLRFLPSGEEMIATKHLNHFNVLGGASPREMAEWSNGLQRAAEASRLGIPVTISTDPRHAFSENIGANFAAGDFSQWPEPLGLAATRDAALVEQFADIARQEYVAVGIRAALHPVADLATEPRWARINGTFGEDAHLVADLTSAYIRGFQGSELGSDSVSCMTKHFPGGGPQQDGEDPHFPYGREQVYPGNNWDYHLIPFEAAFAAGTAQIMPYYGMPIGTEYEEVGFGFNRAIITDLLRQHYGYDGIVCTDWGLVTDAEVMGKPLPARAWGVEHLSRIERVKKILDAGCDQFGGESCPELVIELVETGQISEDRLDESARRLLRDKFRLGLFDNPYVDPEAAQRLVGNAEFKAAGEDAQRKSLVLLRNADMLPLSGRPKIYVEGIDPAALAADADVVTDLQQADVAILRIAAPFEPRDELFLESMFHAGSLAFSTEARERLLTIARTVPTIIDIYLDRPAVIPELADASAALIANFGAAPEALLDVVFGRVAPTGKLPFELPSSMAAVEAQHPDVPYDSEDPLFPFGHGLTYQPRT
jgi:beta-glucosidase